jgi:hypothetical protein
MKWRNIFRLQVTYTHEVTVDQLASGQVDGTAVASRSKRETSGNDQGTTSEAIQTTLHPLAATIVPPENSDRLPRPPQAQMVQPEIASEPTSASVMHPITSRASDTSIKPSEVLSASSEALKDSRVARSRSGIPIYWFADIKCPNERETEPKKAFRE